MKPHLVFGLRGQKERGPASRESAREGISVNGLWGWNRNALATKFLVQTGEQKDNGRRSQWDPQRRGPHGIWARTPDTYPPCIDGFLHCRSFAAVAGPTMRKFHEPRGGAAINRVQWAVGQIPHRQLLGELGCQLSPSSSPFLVLPILSILIKPKLIN